MEEQGIIVFIQFGLRIVGAVVCSQKATELNRSSGGWGFFGFVMPIIAMIWIHFMKPIMKWDENINAKR
ncbi:hypothetical protein JoomaDRAFT_1098 [Galbibacter orientalis DSM 19592]|uniref:Uncharacterized protein n=1 Tax=Galbibacter orientalis DSM 19592 TaxID=926559 RepID=I3C3C5_9FLAO|nr:hypothetical protein [Galbibacter orientalis]EIJ38118.1 hypothetical protein JoomaDRAFT_1098 [Galbibacter orientalis DSM 19592]